MSKKKPRSAASKVEMTRDLVLLTADRNMEAAVSAIVNRTGSLKIRGVSFDSVVHPQRDPGCYRTSPGLLASYRTTHARCLVVFDRVGCGAEQLSREELEAEVDAQLEKTGWKCRAVIVIDPELENWVWGRSPHVATVLGWVNPQQEVRQWLLEQGFLADAAQVKPDRPKEAMEAVLKKVRQPRSSSIYRALAERVTLEGCTEPSFVKLCLTLRHWFSVRSESPQSS